MLVGGEDVTALNKLDYCTVRYLVRVCLSAVPLFGVRYTVFGVIQGICHDSFTNPCVINSRLSLEPTPTASVPFFHSKDYGVDLVVPVFLFALFCLNLAL